MVRVGSEVKANYETLLDALTNEMQALHKELQECKEKLSQEPCEDAISRKAVIEITAETGALETQARVKALPPVTPQPKMGQWIKNAEEWQNVDPPYICSECGSASLRQENFCCSCGAKMQEVEE